MNYNYQSLESALETAAYRCDLNTFRDFMGRVEETIASGECGRSLETEIREYAGRTRSRVFNIHKVANDATTAIRDGKVA